MGQCGAVVNVAPSGARLPGSKPSSAWISRMTLSKLHNVSIPKILCLEMRPAVAPYSCEYQIR